MNIGFWNMVVVFFALIVAAIIYSVRKAFISPKCPFCGEYMDSFYNIESKKYEYQCPKCDYYEERE